MADSGLRIPSDLMKIIEQRQHIWTQYDLSINNKNKLNNLGAGLPAIEIDGPIEKFSTATLIPPDQLQAAVNMLEVELKKIADSKKEIERCKESIREEEARLKRNKIITIVVVVMVLLTIGYFIIMSFG